MSDISAEALSVAIFSTIINRCRLLDRIERVSLEVDDEEHLSEAVLGLDKALGELGTAYEQIRMVESGWLDYETLHANALEEYRKDCEEREKSGGK